MSLVVTPSKLSQSSDCLTLYTQDSTGAYNATTNTGGYGTPNVAYTSISAITLRMGRPNSSTTVDITLDGTSTPTAIQYANPTGGKSYPFTSVNIGQSTTSEALTDGVYPLQEFVAFLNSDSLTEVTATNGSTSVSLSGGGFTFDTSCNYLQLPDGVFYEVASFTSSTVAVLVEPYAGETITSEIWSNVYSGTANLTTYLSSENCATEILGELWVTEVTQSCSNIKNAARNFAMNAFFDLFILQADTSLNDTENFALNVAQYQETYCSGNSNSNCGCGCK